MKPYMLLPALFALQACGPNRAMIAVQKEKIRLEATADEVVRAAGPPELILARKGVETFYYQDGERAVSASLLDGKVVAFTDRDRWPAAAAAAAEDADAPVTTGKVRIGQSETDVRGKLGKPNGLTAANGVESLHWLTGDSVDSVVALKDGKVHGFWDRPISEYTQNVPTEERDEGTTTGRIRVGMSQAEVKGLLGSPDGRSGEKGVTTHRYESDPFFGDEIHYSVGYKDDKVVLLSEFNVSRDEEKKEEAKAKKEAELAAARSQEAESSIFSFLSNPLVQTALAGAVASGINGGKRPRKKTIRKTKTRSTAKRTLTINGTTYTGGEHLGRKCSLDVSCPGGYKCHLITNTSGMCVQ